MAAHGRLYAVEQDNGGFSFHQRPEAKKIAAKRVVVIAVNMPSGILYRLQEFLHPDCIDAMNEADDDMSEEDIQIPDSSLRGLCFRGNQMILVNVYDSEEETEDDPTPSRAERERLLLLADCGPSMREAAEDM